MPKIPYSSNAKRELTILNSTWLFFVGSRPIAMVMVTATHTYRKQPLVLGSH